MSNWERLAEARIQEWLQRPPQQRSSGSREPEALSLEAQLLDETLGLARDAAAEPEGPRRRALERAGAAVETRLLILLESTGRPLAAQRVAELLASARRRCLGSDP
jgi:hypothetical protein